MAKLNDLTLVEARDGLAAGDFSAAELTEDCITAMELARDLNAFITETPDTARERADARRRFAPAVVVGKILNPSTATR